MATVLLDQVVQTDYGQFDIIWDGDHIGFDGDFENFFGGQMNGLAGAADPKGLYVNLARRSGGSAVRIELLSADPEYFDEHWADIVEVSVEIPAGSDSRWATWAGETGGEIPLPAGEHRVRVSAQGRDAGSEDEFADGVVDSYVIQFWPAPRTEDAIVRSDSENGRYWHREVGSRR